jgi:predicted RNA-binding Zn ribbon-like protein
MAEREHASEWKDGFLFLGNDLTLDFLNTRPVQDGVATELLPDFAAVLRWFVAGSQLTAAQAAALQRRWAATHEAQHFTSELRDLRERLRKTVLKWQASGSVPRAMLVELNLLMAEHPMRSRLQATRKGMSTELYVSPQRPEGLLAPIAHSAANLFATADRDRLRQCGSCVLLFLDTSKKGTRRWCSMQLCGNRVKVAAYAARRRKMANAKRV